jgi:DNA-binding sugar fermentation-stimulating protein
MKQNNVNSEHSKYNRGDVVLVRTEDGKKRCKVQNIIKYTHQKHIVVHSHFDNEIKSESYHVKPYKIYKVLQSGESQN